MALLSAVTLFAGCATTSDKDPDKSRLALRAFIDGSDSIMIRGDQMWYRHHAYELPGQWLGGNEPTLINKHEWLPVWDGSLSDRFTIPEKESALPPNRAFNSDTLDVTVKGGWGRVFVAEYPTAENDFTLVLTVDDRGPDGSHWYRIGLDWDDEKAN